MRIVSTKMINEILENHKRDFEGLLPELIKRLIISSIDYKNFRMPAMDDIWVRGFDGVVEILSDNPYLNIGNNAIEIGTNLNTLAKINSDYEKRTKDSLGKDKNETHFVLITPHLWSNEISIDEWINQRKNEWKSIKIFDGAVICDWINSQPNVLCWFLEHYSNTKLDFYSIDNYWDMFSKKSNPLLSPELFLGERDSESEAMLLKLYNNERCLVQSNSLIDAIGFSLSVIKSDNELLYNTIVVKDESTCKVIDKECKGKIILCTYPIIVNNFIPRNNAFVSCYSKENKPVNPIELNKISKQSFFNYLKKAGKQEDQINNEIDSFRCSIQAYIRRHPNEITDLTPKWVQFENIKSIVPFIFFSKLNLSNKETQKLLEDIIGDGFGTIEEKLNMILKMDDSPIYKDNEVVYVFDRDECLNNLSLSIDSIEIHGIVKIIKNHFMNDYYMSGFDFCSFLINFVEFLYIQYGDSQSKIDEVLIDIIQCSISKGKSIWIKYLHYFVDAAPSLCMALFENHILNNNENMNYENEIRWCLEKLCCYEKTKVKAVKYLFKLAMEQDITDNTNYYMESLSNILCLWLGYSSFSLEEKKMILKSYLENYDEKVFSFVVKLLTKDKAFIGSNNKIKNNEKYNCSSKDLSDSVNELAIYALEKSKYNSEVISLIFDSFSCFRLDVYENIAKNVDESEEYLNGIFKLKKIMLLIIKYDKEGSKWHSYKKYYFDTFNLILNRMIGDNLWLEYGCSFVNPNKCFFGNFESNEFDDKYSYEEIRQEYLKKLISEYPNEFLFKLSNCMSDSTYWGNFIAENICLKVIFENISLFYKKKNILVGIMSKIEKGFFMMILQELNATLRLFIISTIIFMLHKKITLADITIVHTIHIGILRLRMKYSGMNITAELWNVKANRLIMIYGIIFLSIKYGNDKRNNIMAFEFLYKLNSMTSPLKVMKKIIGSTCDGE